MGVSALIMTSLTAKARLKLEDERTNTGTMLAISGIIETLFLETRSLFESSSICSGLTITKISDGLVKEYNVKFPERALQPFDA